MATYEGIFIFRPELSQEAQEDNLAKIKEVITKTDGKIENQAAWGKKELTFLINKCSQGIYYFLRFKINSGSISELRKLWKVNENILRFMITRLKKEGE